MAGFRKVAATQSGVIPIVERRAVSVHSRERELIPGLGNVTAADMIVPRLKLLQGLSPEVKDNPRKFIQGEFYHSVLGECMGEALKAIPLQIRRSLELWAPREMNEGLLARSDDGKSWDKPNQRFDVRIAGKKYVWDTKGSVGESGLAEWGTSIPGDPRSPPAAVLTYRTALFLPEYANLGACLMISSKSAARQIQDLVTRIQARHLGGTDFWCQQYALTSQKNTKNNNEWYVPSFRNEGNVTDKEMKAHLAELAKAMATINIRADDDRVDEDLRESRASNAAY